MKLGKNYKNSLKREIEENGELKVTESRYCRVDKQKFKNIIHINPPR